MGLRCAFSLIEVLVVLAIIGFLAGIAVPRVSNSIDSHGVDRAARRVAADLEFARQHAMSTSSTQTVRFLKGDDPGYWLVGLSHPDHSQLEYIVSFASDCHGAELDSVDFSGDLQFTFDMYGVPNTGGSVIIHVGRHYRTISVEAEIGRVSVSQ
jgi:prepilin-type N-terminal cleavage/methylation domain-containing protein